MNDFPINQPLFIIILLQGSNYLIKACQNEVIFFTQSMSAHCSALRFSRIVRKIGIILGIISRSNRLSKFFKIEIDSRIVKGDLGISKLNQNRHFRQGFSQLLAKAPFIYTKNNLILYPTHF